MYVMSILNETRGSHIPDPIPSVPIENFKSRSISELRFASRIAFTLELHQYILPIRGIQGEWTCSEVHVVRD
jgi:hypothetical protein